MHENKIYEDYINSSSKLSDFFMVLPKDFASKLRESNFISQYTLSKPICRLTIVSGQQPAIFGGPLYTYYKVISLSKLSELLVNEFGINAQPIFWVHSWDSDWEEVCVANFLTYDYDIYSVKYIPDDEDKGKLLYKISLNKTYLDCEIDKIFLNIKNSDFTGTLKEEIKVLLNNSSNLSEWSTNLLRYFFANFKDLTIFEPHREPNYTLLSNVLVRAIEDHEELYTKFEKTSLELLKLKYKPQVHKSIRDVFFFIEENEKRTKLIYDDGYFFSTNTGRKWTKSELSSMLKNEPERFTPNLITRCIYQQMLLNPVIYIAGPAEVAYWAQLKDIFEYYSLPMPLIYPRPRVLIIPFKVNKWLSELGIHISELLNSGANLTNYLDHSTKISTEPQEILGEIYAELRETCLPRIHSMLKEKFPNLSEVDKIYSELERKIQNEVTKTIHNLYKLSKQKNEQLDLKISRIKNTLFPQGTYQERVFSPISFFSEYGLEILQEIEKNINIKDFNFQGVVI